MRHGSARLEGGAVNVSGSGTAEYQTALFERAKNVIPGGVNSPVRAYRAVGGVPRFIRQGRGAQVVAEDGITYIDLVMSYGPLIFGHAPPEVVEAVAVAAKRGLTFGAPTLGEVELAETVRRFMPSIESLRLVSSGTEAVMSAVRVARAYTRKTGILKFAGGYHGHSDALLTAAGSGALTLGLPGSAGVPPEVTARTLTVPYGDLPSAEAAARSLPDGGPAVILVEPAAANMGVMAPPSGFLAGLRELATRFGSLLVFDEVITGFRLAQGGAQELYGIRPDLTCLGKIVGGGLPLAGFGGRAEVMRQLAPVGDVYQAGTLSGNPVAVAAGLATLRRIERECPYPSLEQRGAQLEAGLEDALSRYGHPADLTRIGSLVSLRLGSTKQPAWAPVANEEREAYGQFFHRMLDQGVMLPPSPREAMFLSTAHTAAVIGQIVEAANRALAE